MILFAFGEAFRTGTHKALILEYLKLNDMQHLKVEYYGRTRSASQLGSALNALIAAALVFYSGQLSLRLCRLDPALRHRPDQPGHLSQGTGRRAAADAPGHDRRATARDPGVLFGRLSPSPGPARDPEQLGL